MRKYTCQSLTESNKNIYRLKRSISKIDEIKEAEEKNLLAVEDAEKYCFPVLEVDKLHEKEKKKPAFVRGKDAEKNFAGENSRGDVNKDFVNEMYWTVFA